ncbi:protein MAIN-LIKE 2-like [Medicago truncatula]|uniref:protein MAIN-LIKE 2-like n=1 Tax=Medicago truncatula TaxID=3880 RepID=UPI000D2F30F1|nr:protein MAIN-LIKE 2-like [Medicago truncatula]
MTITLDNVHNLLHIPIHGRMLDHDEAMGQERAFDLMTRLLAMSDVDVRAEIRTESAGHISYPTLKRVYEDHLTEARRLDDPHMREELQERARRRQWCVRSFLLYLVGCALFTNKTNRHIDMIYLDCMVDLQTIGKWSWGGMALAYLYDYLDDYVILNNRTIAARTTLFMGWILEHLSGPYPRKKNKEWTLKRPCAGRWLTCKGHKVVHHYRSWLDHLEVDDVRFSTYGDHREIHLFQLIVTYLG